MNQGAIIKKLTAAGVPRSCWNVSTQGTGRTAFREFARSMKQRHESKEQHLCAYICHADLATTILSAEIMAKEFVLADMPTVYTTFNKLLRDLRQPPFEDTITKLDSLYGKGAIVVPSIPRTAEVAVDVSQQYHEAVEYLLGHAYEGGALVVAGTKEVSARMRSGYPMLLERLFVESSEVFGEV